MDKRAGASEALDDSSGVAWAMMHQVFAAAAFLIALVIPFGFADWRLGRAASCLIQAGWCAGIAFGAGHFVASFSPSRARFGYFVWFVPILLWICFFLADVHGETSWLAAWREFIYPLPNQIGLGFTFMTLPVLQSFFYPAGLAIGRRTHRSLASSNALSIKPD